ncbi:hypothetical protein Pmar_PMAR021606 [Perkinsus marinus ATCC 50983]|uniref:Uncharacterized protein n=1 Tax=Perkinsus marinus (strain ATCC 50983 / TXsc) TaxID=423536 RepID=C5L8L9_PERM5|nr:hypothetical protein Pmar_PMAR021606 [Perkinsus marinus ATCC 50983]EER06932.1 hypothetical protein Pmar_PMAR021606 [Perkinsus marinus ATCC 50983]|eukprot:XP_002775116.1 hypothetical protein Pmar_PMAR021606 [Perkinsus marinus ATCC 50983]
MSDQFLPAVDGLSSHPPRLIVIYGDGISEAQEILPSREAREALSASDLIKESVPMDLPMDGYEFTTVRHLIEYPEVDHKLMHEFEDACTRYDEWMDAHRGLHDELATRMQRDAEAKAADKTNKKKKKNTKSWR